MDFSRRELQFLLPALAAAQASGQSKGTPSGTWQFEKLEVKASGQNKSRAVMTGKTHTGFPIEIHETELAPGLPPHAPHHHSHEEMLLIREGIMEVTIEGKVSRLGPGSVAFVASNEEHGWKNAGDTRAHYFVVTFGRGV